VPLVKGSYRFAKNPYTLDGSLNFDICFLNDIAVRNSLLLRDYTDVCPLSKSLIIAVKKWAKDHQICSAAEDRLSSYAWTLLAIFYLQQIRMIPNLQCRNLMANAGYEPGNDKLHCVNALDTAYVPWGHVKRMNVMGT
jgi:DNA polymerase sigma